MELPRLLLQSFQDVGDLGLRVDALLVPVEEVLEESVLEGAGFRLEVGEVGVDEREERDLFLVGGVTGGVLGDFGVPLFEPREEVVEEFGAFEGVLLEGVEFEEGRGVLFLEQGVGQGEVLLVGGLGELGGLELLLYGVLEGEGVGMLGLFFHGIEGRGINRL